MGLQDHTFSAELDRVNLLTDLELLVVRTSSCDIEHRWPLDGVEPMSPRAEGHLVPLSEVNISAIHVKIRSTRG